MARAARIAIIGGGPAGLAAAEAIAETGAGHHVTVYDRMPTLGRKLLMAGRGGLNLTHSEPIDRFLARYGEAAHWLQPVIEAYPPEALRAWAEGLGIETFVGTSGRVFPRGLKASPLLRAWLRRLGQLGVEMVTRARLEGLDAAGRPVIAREGEAGAAIGADATVLALGGASWPRLGSDGGWVAMLEAAGVRVSPLAASNAGLLIVWSEHLRERFHGTALKRVRVAIEGGGEGGPRWIGGDLVVTRKGLEGGPVYGLSGAVRQALGESGRARLIVDLRPDLTAERLAEQIGRVRAGESLANRLRKGAGLPPVAIGLLREAYGGGLAREPAGLAAAIKSVALEAAGLAGLERAISTAGGVAREALDERLMVRAMPGLFIAGEMLDFDAPTGGYLLQAAFSTGRAAGQGVLARLGGR
ncbi:MAG: TIGR03862 family flavoprotein [Hyphomicrobiaceae bacterium]